VVWRIRVNPAMTDGQHREAVKAHLDELICLQTTIEEQRDSVQEGMMKRYDQRFQEIKGMGQGSLVMTEAKHVSVPTLIGANAQRRLAPPRGSSSRQRTACRLASRARQWWRRVP
jgi:hypothetical protein